MTAETALFLCDSVRAKGRGSEWCLVTVTGDVLMDNGVFLMDKKDA